MNQLLLWALVIPLFISFIIGVWNIYFKTSTLSDLPSLDPISLELDWLRLYSQMEEDYYSQNEIRMNFRYFLPRTYFVIPNHLMPLYSQPLFNEDLFHQRYGMNQTFTEREIKLKLQHGKNIAKTPRLISFLTGLKDKKEEEVRMFQKKVDTSKDVLMENRFFKAFCYQNKIYSSVNVETLSQYFQKEEAIVLANRILEIQKYLSQFTIFLSRRCFPRNQFEIEILFTQNAKGQYVRPYVGNIFNYIKTNVQEIDLSKLTEIQLQRNYIKDDDQYKIFSYDYDFRLKRVVHQCVSNYKYHKFWIQKQPDFLYIQPICDDKMSQQEINKIYKRSDILLMKKLDKSKALIKNLTMYNFLENSDKVNNKLHFYEFSHELDRLNKNYDYNLSAILPKTYSFNLLTSNYTAEETEFMSLESGDMWITKPLDQLGGKGIQVYQNSHSIKQFIKNVKKEQTESLTAKSDGQMIIQKYISNPLLVNRKKFDIRSYVLVISTNPYIVYFLNGYIRLTINDYVKSDTNLLTHLVNTNIQKTHPEFNAKKDDSHWDLERFEETLIKEYNMTKEQIDSKIYDKMRSSSSYLFKGLEPYFNNQNANFQIFGLDFMFDDEFNAYFIEVNEIPQLLGKTSTHNKVCPEIVNQQLDSSIYANGQILKGEQIDMNILQQKCKDCNLLIHQDEVHYLKKIQKTE